MNMANIFKKDKLVIIISLLMIIFGIAEIVTGIRHEFFGLVTTEQLITTIVGIGLGLCYLLGGIFLFVYKKWSLILSLVLLILDITGRLIMIFTGMYPISTAYQTFGIVTGTLVATFFAVIVFIKMRKLTKE
jgi:hypothetical protein